MAELMPLILPGGQRLADRPARPAGGAVPTPRESRQAPRGIAPTYVPAAAKGAARGGSQLQGPMLTNGRSVSHLSIRQLPARTSRWRLPATLLLPPCRRRRKIEARSCRGGQRPPSPDRSGQQRPDHRRYSATPSGDSHAFEGTNRHGAPDRARERNGSQMSATLQKPKPTHREETPVKECARCGCWLRSFGNEPFCDPCSKPVISKEDHAEIFKQIAEMTDARHRRKAFEFFAELAAEREEAAA